MHLHRYVYEFKIFCILSYFNFWEADVSLNLPKTYLFDFPEFGFQTVDCK